MKLKKILNKTPTKIKKIVPKKIKKIVRDKIVKTEIKISNEEIKLYDIDKIYFFINELSKGGIIEQIKIRADYLSKELNKSVYLVYGETDLSENLKYDHKLLNVEKIIKISEFCHKKIEAPSLFIFTQLKIANNFINYFESNYVIIEYHRNINKITKENFQLLITLSNAIKVGKIRLLEKQHKINKLFSNNPKFQEFINYIPIPEKSNNDDSVDRVKKIVYCGRLSNYDKAKNMDGLYRIISNLKDEFEFHIYGEGEYKEKFEKIGKNVYVHGHEYNKEKIYEDKDLLILPSVEEAFPLVILEALSYGVKVITYNNSGIVKATMEEKYVEKIKLNDENSFINKIRKMKGYNRQEIINYFKNNFSVENSDMFNLVSNVYQSNIARRVAHVYKITETAETINIKVFLNGYKKSIDEFLINTSFTYKLIRNEDYFIYSSDSINFPQNFIEIQIIKEKIKPFDFLTIYEGSNKLKFHPLRLAPEKVEINDEYYLKISPEVIQVEPTNKKHIIEIIKESKMLEEYLFNDRKIYANDNAEHLYRYFEKEKCKNYYVLTSTSNDFTRLLRKGYRIIEPNSRIHILLYSLCKYVFTSHLKSTILKPTNDNNINYLQKGNTIFIQHGVTFAESDYKYYLNNIVHNCESIICTSKYEQQLVNKISNFQDKPILGFPRYDYIFDNNTKKQQIVYMPTWNRNLNISEILETKYYKTISDLLNSRELADVLNKYNYELIFIPHPEFMSLLDSLIKCGKTANLKILNPFEINWSDMVSNAAMLITDESSLRFDFAYLKKPVIQYYNYAVHSQCEIDLVNEMFYKVTELNHLIDTIVKNINNNFTIEKEKQNKIERFFENIDNNNCKRIFEYYIINGGKN